MQLALIAVLLPLALPAPQSFEDSPQEVLGVAPPAEPEPLEAIRAPARFTGRAVRADGRPVQGAVVVTSAGGKALCAEDGSFALEVLVPLAAEAVQVTAVAGPGGASGSLLASALVQAPFDDAQVGELVLELGAACSPDWIPTFGERPGTLGPANALAVFDDGSGPALYVGGQFNLAGSASVSNLGKWDGARWSSPGGGPNGVVRDLVVFDDGNGPALYLAGDFLTAGGIPVNRIARFDGANWSALHSGANAPVHCLTTFDDGNGLALYAGGEFTSAGGLAANRVARWDGSGWSALLGGVGGPRVSAMCAHDDGSGPALYVGGSFVSVDGMPASHIARWNGSSWSTPGGGFDGTVGCLAALGSGAGARLIAGGSFTSAGGQPASRIAAWDGASWSALGSGLSDQALALYAREEQGGSMLYVGGSFLAAGGAPSRRVARWDGQSWHPMGEGSPSDVRDFVGFDSGKGEELHFSSASVPWTFSVARWTGASWIPLGAGVDGMVQALTSHPRGGVVELVAAGHMGFAGEVELARIGSWDGEGWSAFGSGVSVGAPPFLAALASQDLGHGPELFAGGMFSSAGSTATRGIASWRQEDWAPLGPGLTDPMPTVLALLGHDDGSGPSIFVGGNFIAAGSINLSHIGRWDGEYWWWMGSGLDAPVNAFAVYDDGGGPTLFVGGRFWQVGGVLSRGIAKWDGTSFSPVGGGMAGSFAEVYALAVYDDGSGLALYAGGAFASAGGVPGTASIARWNGLQWSAVGDGLVGEVAALAVYDEGTGPELYAGGWIQAAGGVAANRIAKWNGQRWAPLGEGVQTLHQAAVRALAVHDVGDGPHLYVGGSFTGSPAGDSHLARWGGCAAIGTAYCFGEEGACPCDNPGQPGEGCANSTGSGARLRAAGSTSLALDNLSMLAEGIAPGRPVLLFSGSEAINGGLGAHFGDGLRCAGQNLRRLGSRLASDQGQAEWGPGIASLGGYVAGQTVRLQAWYRDPQGSPCGSLFNLSHGLELLIAR